MQNANCTEEYIYLIAEFGHSLHLQGHYREAVVVFQGLVAVDPENHYCLDALAAAWLAIGEPERAIEHMNSLLARQPADLSVRARRMEAYLQMGRVAAAAKDFAFLEHLLPAGEIRRLELSLEAARRAKNNLRHEQHSEAAFEK